MSSQHSSKETIDEDTLPSGLYAALADDSLEEDEEAKDPVSEEFEEEDEEEKEEEEEVVVLRKKPTMATTRIVSNTKTKRPLQMEDAYLRHLKSVAEEEEKRKNLRGINWKTTCFNVFVVLLIFLVYMYYTYGIISMTPPDTFRPAYALMITHVPYNTTARKVTTGEIEMESLGVGKFSDRTPFYLIFRTLKWYAQSKDFVVVCAHHLQHDLNVHPQMCVLHNKAANQFYHMLNPVLKGFSKEKDVRVEESIACGNGKKTEKSRYKTIHISYTSYPSKQSMQVEFEAESSSTLQLVMEEMDGKYACI